MFCAGTFGSAPNCSAVSGINCMSPIAPFGEIAPQLKFDSAATMLCTNAAGTLCLAAALAIKIRVSAFGRIGISATGESSDASGSNGVEATGVEAA